MKRRGLGIPKVHKSSGRTRISVSALSNSIASRSAKALSRVQVAAEIKSGCGNRVETSPTCASHLQKSKDIRWRMHRKSSSLIDGPNLSGWNSVIDLPRRNGLGIQFLQHQRPQLRHGPRAKRENHVAFMRIRRCRCDGNFGRACVLGRSASHLANSLR